MRLLFILSYCFKGFLFWQRFPTSALKTGIEHELCAYPLDLFESTSLMQKSDKPPLATAIVDFVKSKSNADVIC